MDFCKLVTLAAVMLSPIAANATKLIDGSFETTGQANLTTNYCYDAIATPGGAACSTSAWSGTGLIASGNSAWGGTIAQNGNFYSFVQGSTALSQTFTSTNSGTAVLTWYDAGRSNVGGAQSYTVTINDGVTSKTLGTFATVTGQAFSFRTVNASLLANTSYQLVFTGLATTDQTAFIDNVTLATVPSTVAALPATPATVPEPAVWGMLVLGFGLVGAIKRRRLVSVSI